MKNLIFVFFFGALLVSCEDYSQQFDEINAAVEELAAENAALEAQLLGMQAASASAAQATAAQLAGFQAQVGQITAALTSIVQGLGELGEANQGLGALVQALSAQVAAINAQIAAIVTNIDSLSTDGDTLAAMIAAIQDAIDDITCQIAEINGEECATAPATTSYMPTYTGAFGGYVVADNVHTFPAGAEAWGGVANENAAIYPLTFDNGGTITFTASSAGADVGIYFRFERLPYPNVDPAFSTASATISGSTATEYTITVDAQAAGTTYSSALLYLTTRDVAVTITDVTITVNN